MEWTEELTLSPEEQQDGILRSCHSYQASLLEIPEGVVEIASDAFRGNGHIIGVQLPASLEKIGDRAFSGCNNLRSIIGGRSLRSIGREAFQGCALNELTIQPSVREVGDHAFASCRNLTAVDIPVTVRTLGRHPFYRCLKLKSWKLPAHLCPADTSGEGVLGIPDGQGFFIDGHELLCYAGRSTRIDVPEQVTIIRAGAFDERLNNEDVNIEINLPKALKRLEHNEVFLRSNVHVSLPPDYLKRASALPQSTTELLESSWKNQLTLADAVSLYLFQSGKLGDSACRMIQHVEPEQVASLMLKRLSSRLTKAQSQRGHVRAAEYYLIWQDQLSEAVEQSFRTKLESGPDHLSLVLEAAGVDPENPAFSNIRFQGSEEKADPSLVRKAIAGYAALGLYLRRLEDEIPVILPETEKAADELDRESLQSQLDRLLPKTETEIVQRYPYLRYASTLQVQCYLLTAGVEQRAGIKRAGGVREVLEPLLLSSTSTALVHMVTHSIAERRWFERYLRVHASEDQGPLCFPELFGLDADYHCRYTDSAGQDFLEVSFADGEFQLCDMRTRRPRRQVPNVPEEADACQRAAAGLKDMRTYYDGLVQWVRMQQMDSYLLGTELPCEVWMRIYGDPCLAPLGREVIFEQSERTFIWDGQYPRSPRGRRKRLDPKAPVRVAHPADMQETDLADWRQYLRRRKSRPPFEQLREPVYTPEEIHHDRYSGCHIEAWDLDKAESQLGFVQSLREKRYLAIGDTGKLQVSLPDSVRGSAKLKLGEITVHRLDRLANHAIYLLDLWTMKQRVAKDDLSILKALRTLPADKLKPYLDLAVSSGAAQLTAALLEYTETKPRLEAAEEFSLDA